MTSFPNAKYWVQAEEWEFAWNPPTHQEAIYIKCDFDVLLERMRLVAGHVDMFGDGTIQLVPTPGHTKGHQSMLVKGASDHTGWRLMPPMSRTLLTLTVSLPQR